MPEPAEGRPRIYIPNPRLWRKGATPQTDIRRRHRKLLETLTLLEGLRAGSEEQRKRAKARLWQDLPTGFCASVNARHEAYNARDKETRHLDRLLGRARGVRDVIERLWIA